MGTRVHQEDETKLKATVVLAAGNEIEVTQDTAADLLATVTQAEKDRVISGALDSSNPETDDDIIPKGEIRETPIALLYGFDLGIEDSWQRVYTDSAHRLSVNPYNIVAANLKTEVTPSGDMARKALYDRDVSSISSAYQQALAAHAYTDRWTYTVPGDHQMFHTQYHVLITPKMATAGKKCRIQLQLSTDGGDNYDMYGFFLHDSTTINYQYEGVPTNFYLNAGDIIRGQTASDDTVNHTFIVNALYMEYDA